MEEQHFKLQDPHSPLPREEIREDSAIPIAHLGAVIGLFVILAVLGAAAVFGMASLRGAKELARISAFRVQLADIRVAIKAYETDYGAYPPAPGAALVRALSTPGPRGLPYYDFSRCEKSESGELLDFRGHPVVYQRVESGASSPPGTRVPAFRLYSVGPNGKDEGGAGDDVTWER